MLEFRPCLCAALGEELGRAWLSCSWRCHRICTCQMHFVSLSFWHTLSHCIQIFIFFHTWIRLCLGGNSREECFHQIPCTLVRTGGNMRRNIMNHGILCLISHLLSFSDCIRPLQEAETWLGQADGWVQRQPWISRCRCGLHHGRTVFVREARSHSSQRIDYNGHHIPSYPIILNHIESHGYFDREHAGRTIALELPVQRVCIEQLPLLRSRDTPQSSRVAAKKVGGMSTDLHVIHHVEIESWVIFDNISIQESWLFIFFHDKMLTCFKSILWTVRMFQLHFRSSSVMCFRMFCSGMESPVIWRRWKGKGEVRHPCPYPNIPLLLNKFITCRQLCLLSSNMLAHGPWHWNPKPVYSLLKRYEAVNAVRSFDVRCRCFLKSKATSGLKEKGELREPSWPLTGLSGWSRLQLLEEVCRRESGTVSWPSGFRLA